VNTVSETKVCRLCNEDLPLTSFTKHKATRDGLRHECRACRKKQEQEYKKDPFVAASISERKKKYDEANKESIQRYRQVKYKADANTPKGRAYSLFKHAERRARDNDLPFDLTLEYVNEKLFNGVCEVTGIPFVFDYASSKFTIDDGGNLRNPFTASIDKIDPTKGYTKDNCQFVVYMYNTCKNSFSDETVKYFVKEFVNNINGGDCE
jgi:hypothetical protein